MYERFTDRARKVMQLANQEAQVRNNNEISTVHILLALTREDGGVFAMLGREPERIRIAADKFATHFPAMVPMGRLPVSELAKQIVQNATIAAADLGHSYVGPEHILMGLLMEKDGDAFHVLYDFGIFLESVRALLGGKRKQNYRVEQLAAVIYSGLRMGDYRFDSYEDKQRAKAAGSTPEVMFAIDGAQAIIKECERRMQ